MEIQRVVEIYHPAGGKRGTGYLLAPGLVLTARHVVDQADAQKSAHAHDTQPCRVRWYRHGSDGTVTDESGWVDARVAWAAEGRVDAALLVPAIGDSFRPDIRPVSLGQPDGAAIPVVAVGFPRAVSDENRSDFLQVNGHVDAISKVRSGSLLIALSSSAPLAAESWRGVSGAALFAGDALIGVITQVPGLFGSDALQALRISEVAAQPGAAALLAAAQLELPPRVVTAATVAALPAGGRWEPLRARYAESVVTTYCRIDYAGIADSGAEGRRLAASDAYSDVRFIGEDGVITGMSELVAHRQLILLGGPGSGKSTTLKQILAHAASHPSDNRQPVPVWLPLVELPRDGALTPARILDHLVEQARNQLGLAEIGQTFFEEILRQGAMIVAFDALDEAGGLARRQQVRDLILECARAWPSCRILVSSRPAQHDETPLTSAGRTSSDVRFARFEVDRLSREQIPAFLRAAFDDDGRISDAILARPELDALIASPLTLSLLARVAQQRGELPAHRVDLFARWVETACIAWEEAKSGSVADADQAAVRLHALYALAWALQTHGDGAAAALTQQAARQAVAPFFSAALASTKADALLTWLAQRTGLLVMTEEVGRASTRRLLRFNHLQLQEFLAGCELARRFELDGTAEDALRGRWFRTEWLEVLAFAVSVLSRDGDLHNMFVRELLAQPDPYDDLLHRRVLLAAALIAEVPWADDDIVDRTVEGLRAIILGGAEQQLRASELLLRLAHHSRAHAALRDLADGGPLAGAIAAAGEPTRHDEIPWRLRAAEALAAGAGKSEGLLHLERLDAYLSAGLAPPHGMEGYAFAYATPLHLRLPVAVRRYQWGQQDAALDSLKAMFETVSTLPEQRSIVEMLDSIGEQAMANTLVDSLAQQAGSIDLPTAVWCHQRGRLAADSIAITHALDEAKRRIEEDDPHSFMPPDDIATSLSAALELAADSDPPELHQLFSAALQHEGLIWYWAGRIREAVPAFASPATAALVKLVTSDELSDNSRRRGMVRQLCDEPDDELAVPALLELLRHERTLRWTGDDVVESLRSRGRTSDALAVLQQLVMSPAVEGEVRSAALPLAERLVPGSKYAWLDTLYRSSGDPAQDAARVLAEGANAGIGSVARGWFAGIARDEDGRAFLKAVKSHPNDTWFTDCARDALYGGVIDSGGSEDDEREPPPTLAELEDMLARALAEGNSLHDPGYVPEILSQMKDIGALDAAVLHAQAWLEDLGAPTSTNAVAFAYALVALHYAGIWRADWLDLAAQAARLLAPQERHSLMWVIQSRA